MCGGYRGKHTCLFSFPWFCFVLFPASEFFSSFPPVLVCKLVFFFSSGGVTTLVPGLLLLRYGWKSQLGRKPTLQCPRENHSAFPPQTWGPNQPLSPQTFSWFLCWVLRTVEDRNFLSFLWYISRGFLKEASSHANLSVVQS